MLIDCEKNVKKLSPNTVVGTLFALSLSLSLSLSYIYMEAFLTLLIQI